MEKIILISQIVVSVLLIIFILLQQRGTALGAGFGGSGDSYSTKRGVQKNLYILTIISGVLFVLLALLNLII